MLTLENVTISFNEKEILKNLNLKIGQGELHLIVGGDQSGKSALAHYLCGYPEIVKTSGKTTFKKRNLDKINPANRFKNGLFTTFQYPPEIEGLATYDLLIQNTTLTKIQDLDQRFDAICEFLDLRKSIKHVPMSLKYLTACETKKLELLQVLFYLPELTIMDELDEDLSNEDLSLYVKAVNNLVSSKKSVLIITNNKYLLETLNPTYLHILAKGKLKTFTEKKLFNREIGSVDQ